MKLVDKFRQRLIYDPRTGVFVWKQHRCKNFIGKRAGFLNKSTKYWIITIDNKHHQGHVVAWAMHYGVLPKFDIDHRNTEKADNWIMNLRRSNKSNNGANRPMQRTNTSGFKGVFWMKKAKTWLVQIRARNQLYYIGIYKNKVDAARAYDAAAIKHFGEHARTNFKAAA